MHSLGHVYVVKTLYRRILSIHRRMPRTLQVLGDQYVKDEFRRHKNVSMEQAAEFIQEWKIYADMLQHQQARGHLGSSLPVEKVDDFSKEQLGQLYALQQEATKESSDENTHNKTSKK